MLFQTALFIHLLLLGFPSLVSALSIDTSMSAKKEMLLKTVQSAFSSASDISVDAEIIQANAVGYKLSVSYNDNDESEQPEQLFVKKVLVDDYVSNRKDWADLRRTLLYARTETRFYRDYLPTLTNGGALTGIVPKAYLATIDLEGLIPDSEPIVTTESMQHDLSALTPEQTANRGSWIVMECVSDEFYFQDSPLTIAQCRQCLEAAASLHASAWNQKELLSKASQQLSSGPVFGLATRNPKELAGLCESWEHFTTEFESELNEFLESSPQARELGPRCQRLAHHVAAQVTPTDVASHPHATLIHGDYKAMNVFLPTQGQSERKPVFIDLASIGVGLGMSDIAMHIRHAVRPEDLENGTEEALVRYYYDCLVEQIPPDAKYEWNDAWREYKYASVDYFRFFLGRMWKTATHETMAAKRDNPNIHLINRNIEAAVSYCAQINEFLLEIEADYELTN